MSTNDVPGANPANGDKLAMGCWAEHKDGSLIFVEGAEDNRVVYSVFDMAKDPIMEYRDAMVKDQFNLMFTKDAWTWHDKTPFPWNKVIKKGAMDGPRHASAADTLNAAEKLAERLKLRGAKVTERALETGAAMRDRLQQAIKDVFG